MFARALLLAAALALCATSAAAAGGGGGGGASKQGNRIQASFSLLGEDEAADAHSAPPQANPRSVDLPVVAMPVFEDGFLLSYLFVTVRVTVAEGVNPWRLREQAPKTRDALIRAAHRLSVGQSDDPHALDPDRARAVAEEGLSQVLSDDQIERIDIMGYDVKSMRD